MSLFPFFGDTVTEVAAGTNLPLYKEVAWDFQNNIPNLKNGEYEIVTENEAVKTWAYKALKTERFQHLIYSWNYGSEIDSIIGQSYTPNLTKAECIRYIEEALLINPYIKAVSEVEVSFSEGHLTVSGTLETIYGETEVEVRV